MCLMSATRFMDEDLYAMSDLRVKHGYSQEPLYPVWKAMRQRCFNPNNKAYKWYGARGISVCDEWNDYAAFRKWAISHGYEKGLTIDRIDSNRDYCPENCRWVSQSIQGKNRRKTDKWINKPCKYNPNCMWRGIELCKQCETRRLYYNKRHREYMARRRLQQCGSD